MFLKTLSSQSPSLPVLPTVPVSLLQSGWGRGPTHQFSLGSLTVTLELIFLALSFTLAHQSPAWQWRLQGSEHGILPRIYIQLKKNKKVKIKPRFWTGARKTLGLTSTLNWLKRNKRQNTATTILCGKDDTGVTFLRQTQGHQLSSENPKQRVFLHGWHYGRQHPFPPVAGCHGGRSCHTIHRKGSLDLSKRALHFWDSGAGNSQEPSEGSSGTRLQLKCDFSTPGACSVAPCGRGIVKSQRQELASGHLWALMGVLFSLPTSEWGWGRGEGTVSAGETEGRQRRESIGNGK